MTKKTFIKGLISATMVASMALPMIAMAQSGQVTANELLPNEIGTNIGTGTTDIRITIARIIRTAMSLLGIIAVLIILYGGFKWMTAAGSDEAVGDAKKIITAGIIGLVIILTAYAIASFVINSLVTATSA
jgi:Zn-dependent protease with chaperone function